MQISENILGVKINAIDMRDALQTIEGWIKGGESQYVCVTPIHAVMDCYLEPSLKKIFNASGMTTPDGMGIVWLLRLLGFRRTARVYGPDLMLAVCEFGLDKGWRHYFYGSTKAVSKNLIGQLQAKFPGLIIAGQYAPPFRPLAEDEKELVAAEIDQARPNVIWVGLSTPKQERWMGEFVNRLNPAVLVGVGAAFDFLSGSKPQAPRWVQRSGLEWLFRLVTEPKRLWRRYIKYPLFLILIIAQRLGLRSYDL